MMGSGGTLCREAVLLGVPTISFHFWDVIAKYLHKKGFLFQRVTSIEKIVKIAKRMRKPEKYKVNMEHTLKKLESPVSITVHHIKKCIEKHSY